MGESIKDYSNKFKNVYKSVAAEINPPPGLALIRYLDGLDADMAYQIIEISPTTLEDIQNIAVNVQAKLQVKKAKLKTEKRATIKEEASTSSDIKLDSLAKTMEKMMEKMTL